MKNAPFVFGLIGAYVLTIVLMLVIGFLVLKYGEVHHLLLIVFSVAPMLFFYHRNEKVFMGETHDLNIDG